MCLRSRRSHLLAWSTIFPGGQYFYTMDIVQLFWRRGCLDVVAPFFVHAHATPAAWGGLGVIDVSQQWRGLNFSVERPHSGPPTLFRYIVSHTVHCLLIFATGLAGCACPSRDVYLGPSFCREAWVSW